MDNKINKTKKPKDNFIVRFVSVGFIVLILFGGVFYFYNYDKNEEIILPKDKTLGDRLADAGWMVYVASICPACIIQKDILGNQIDGLKVHYCDVSLEDNKVCHDNGIIAIPTWYNVYSNEMVVGVKELVELEEMAR